MGKNMLVYKASAGSGKTFNLARIYVEELLKSEGHSIDENLRSIMAITFTHKAANEMKERVILFLENISENDPSDAKAQYLIGEISSNLGLDPGKVVERAGIALELLIENFGFLSISTIDSFSHRIIRSFSKEMDLHYDFDVSMDQDAWLELAVDRLFDRFGGDDEKDKQLSDTLVHFFMTTIEESSNWNLKWMVNAFAKKINIALQEY